MPYVSDAQRKKFHAMERRGEIAHETVHEFDEASRGKKLPKKVGKMTKLRVAAADAREMRGHAHGTLVSGLGASPAPYDPIPDYAEIYYQPDDDPRHEDESEMRDNRRKAMGVANRGKYGFHGTGDVSSAPILRYENDDFPKMERDGSGRKMRFDSAEPASYEQPVTPGDRDKDDEDNEHASEVAAHRIKRDYSAPTRGPLRNQKQRLVIGKAKLGITQPKTSSAPKLAQQPKAAKQEKLAQQPKLAHVIPRTKAPGVARRMGGG